MRRSPAGFCVSMKLRYDCVAGSSHCFCPLSKYCGFDRLMSSIVHDIRSVLKRVLPKIEFNWPTTV